MSADRWSAEAVAERAENAAARRNTRIVCPPLKASVRVRERGSSRERRHNTMESAPWYEPVGSFENSDNT